MRNVWYWNKELVETDTSLQCYWNVIVNPEMLKKET